MATFPTNLGCVTTNGYNESFPVTRQYLGGRKFTYPTTVNVEVFIGSHSDMEDFMRWYITDLAWGTNSFTISIPLFGVTRAWSVKIVNDINVKNNENTASIRTIPMVLEVLDDIDTYIN